ncbi:hypothetical protein MMC25_000901 [Agyrium rufum]|nr:hypothetical protein [Agyrium rufum]
MAINFMLPLRAAQALFAIIVLGLSASVANYYPTRSFGATTSPSQINFLIFNAVWTLLFLVYSSIVPVYLPRLANKFAILALETLTMLFWFAGFVALAVFVSSLSICSGNVCRSAQAAIVFAAFEWLLFVASTALAAIHVWQTRMSGSTAPAPNAEMRAQV